ncbi:MAG: magnesium-translocating P-type ATPase, partial [bacterium]|nr:magnesium-translocating P-type ATPase [bacterium]
STVLDFLNTYKSEKISEKLLAKVAITATVLRDGLRQEIVFKNIVPGDIVYLSAGDVVPADCHVLKADDFFLNQSALTGESYPVEKFGLKEEKDGEFVFMGTSVITGYGTVLVVRTGEDAEFGKITKSLASVETHTDFEIGMRKFSFFIMRITFVLVSLVFLFNALFGRGILDSFIFAVAIAVGLTPELLPMIMSVALSHGSKVMSQKDVVVKNLSSIQNFGGMNIFCSDKTGTLTEDKITLVKYVDTQNRQSEQVLRYAYINSSFQTGLKNPLDAAVLTFKHLSTHGCEKVDEIPYDFHRKRLSIVARCESKIEMVTKGQPEEIFKISRYFLTGGKVKKLTPAAMESCRRVHDDYSRQGYKMLAVATREVEGGRKVYSPSDERDMILVGFVGFYDPAKQSASQTLVKMHEYGVEVKIITGDNELVTEKICRDLNLPIKGIMTGDKLAWISDEALAVKALDTTIFARFSPEQKNRVITSLRSKGRVVGYLGDGINDAPSLKSADVGISVDNAVDVARETADIILTRKSLRVLTDGIIEGRKTFGNTMKYLMMGVSSNFGNMFSLIGAALYLPFLPMRPIQVLLNNTLYDISQVTIPSDNVDPEYLKKPKHWNMAFVKKYMIIFGLISSVFDILTFILLFGVFHFGAAVFQAGWFLESLATQTFVIYLIRTKRFVFKSRPSWYLMATTIAAVFMGFLFATTAIGKSFSFEPLPMKVVLMIFSMVLIYLVMVEAVKHWFYKRYDM